MTPAHLTDPHQLTIRGVTYQLPQYFPDATQAVVRTLDNQDLAKVGIEGLVINTYHLRQHPGIEVLNSLGGVKKLMNWSGLTASDSGGFQLFSLIKDRPEIGHITDEGVVLYSPSHQKKHLFTPEESIQVQFAINSDLMICLDDFTPDHADSTRINQSVSRTIAWAARCKTEFERQLALHHFSDQNRPWLIAPIQGHRDWAARQHCATELCQIGFDGYGLGGWPFTPEGKFDYEMAELNASYTPDNQLRFALGIGKPENIIQLFKLGYHIFDCVLPTRDARHQRLYVFPQNPDQIDFLGNEPTTTYLYLDRGIYATDHRPISPFCDCPTCQHYSRAYLHHLFKVKDVTAWRLATLHNLYYYAQIINRLRSINS